MNSRIRSQLGVGIFLLAVFGFGLISLWAPGLLIENVPALQAASNDGQSSTTAVRTLITTADVIVGSLLTIFLGWVYLRQNRILDSQSKILKAAHQPLLQVASEPKPVDEIPNSDDLPDDMRTSGEWVEIGLRNTGNDVATNLQLQCLVVIEGEYEVEFPLENNDLISTIGSPQTGAGASSIRPDGDEHTFFASTKIVERRTDLSIVERIRAFLNSKGIIKWGGHESQTPLGNLLQDLTNDDRIDQVAFGLAVTYQSAIDLPANKHSEQLYLEPAKRLDDSVSLTEASLVAAWNQGDRYWIERLRRQLDK